MLLAVFCFFTVFTSMPYQDKIKKICRSSSASLSCVVGKHLCGNVQLSSILTSCFPRPQCQMKSSELTKGSNVLDFLSPLTPSISFLSFPSLSTSTLTPVVILVWTHNKCDSTYSPQRASKPCICPCHITPYVSVWIYSLEEGERIW